MKNYYVVINKNGGMDGMCWTGYHIGWIHPVFPQEYMARRFIEENPQDKGVMFVKKIKIDLRQRE